MDILNKEVAMFVGKKKELDKDDEFQNVWFSSAPSAEKKSSPVKQNIESIKQYAYDAFDKLDTNKNGFIETDELYAAMNDEATPMRDKSYIMFLLTNQADIAASAEEGVSANKDGISRVDLDLYFRVVLSRLT
jgi:hypothetical protein